MYSISYIPHGGAFPGQECSLWYAYGQHYQFNTYAEAVAQIDKLPGYPEMKVVPLRIAQQFTVEMVEVFSGRRKVEGFRRPVINPARPTYQRVMEILANGKYSADRTS